MARNPREKQRSREAEHSSRADEMASFDPSEFFTSPVSAAVASTSLCTPSSLVDHVYTILFPPAAWATTLSLEEISAALLGGTDDPETAGACTEILELLATHSSACGIAHTPSLVSFVSTLPARPRSPPPLTVSDLPTSSLAFSPILSNPCASPSGLSCPECLRFSIDPSELDVEALPSSSPGLSCVQTWIAGNGSNGSCKGVRISSSTPIPLPHGMTDAEECCGSAERAAAHCASSLLSSLPTSFTHSPRTQSISPRTAFLVFYAAALQGGCYGKGEAPESAFELAWSAMSFTADVGPPASEEERESTSEHFEECSWFAFLTPWHAELYAYTGWQWGVLCIHPSRRTAIALSARDTD